MQKWYLFYFCGEDSEVNINISKIPEFSEWKWENSRYIEENVTDFRKSIYRTVFKKFDVDIKNALN